MQTASTSNSPEPSVSGHHDRPWEPLAELLELGDADALDEYLLGLSTHEQALALSRLDGETRDEVLSRMHADVAAELIGNLTENQAARAIASLQPETAAAIVHELPSDERADVLGDLSDQQAAAILDALPRDEAEATRELSGYEDNVAGGLMVLEMLRFSPDMTVAKVIEELNQNADTYSDFDVRYAYVCEQDGKLVGVLPMQNLLFVRRQARLSDLMIRDPLSIRDDTALEDLIEFFESHAFVGAPVVDDQGRLKGVLHREAVQYEETRAAAGDFLKSQGIIGGEELRSMPLWLRAKRRLSWLSINIVLNIGAAIVIASFQDTLQAVIALAVFLPIISDMSGCSGNQAVAVSMRELSLGLVRPTELFRVWIKEASVGLINGAVLGSLVALGAAYFHSNVYLGVVVGVALFVNTIIAVSIGGVVPLILKRFDFDPAVASGPLLTTVTDMCGFFLVLGLATLMLSKLVT